MHVRIEEVRAETGGSVKVSFASDWGGANAEWIGEPPRTGVEYDVELDIPGVLEWGQDVVAAETAAQPAIRQQGQEVLLDGRVESVADDGVAMIRIGSGLVMIEALGDAVPPGTVVRIRSRRLLLADTNT